MNIISKLFKKLFPKKETTTIEVNGKSIHEILQETLSERMELIEKHKNSGKMGGEQEKQVEIDIVGEKRVEITVDPEKVIKVEPKKVKMSLGVVAENPVKKKTTRKPKK